MDFVTIAKNVGAVLGTASICAYASGYLALRARAHALGTDPAFTLVDEAYVFAGFRVLLTVSLVLLLFSPIILLVRWGALKIARHLRTGVARSIQWPLLIVLGIWTLLSFGILKVNGMLIQRPMGHSLLARAILGTSMGASLGLMFSTIVLAALSASWLQARISSNSRGVFEILLGVVLALQIVILPVYHGALLSDRNVRILASVPSSVHGMEAPIGIVDRSKDHATLMGLDASGSYRLTTVGLDDLNGIAVERIVSLGGFVTECLPRDQGAKGNARGVPSQGYAVLANDSKDRTGAGTETEIAVMESRKGFFQAIVEYLHIVLVGIGSLGESDVYNGELWVVELDATGDVLSSGKVGTADDLAWPVAGPNGTIYAVQNESVVVLRGDGKTVDVLDHSVQWWKLLGVTPDGTLLGLISDDNDIKPAALQPDGTVEIEVLSSSEEEQRGISILMQESRRYGDEWALSVRRSERGGRGYDVFLKSGSKVTNVSDCGDDSCGQPSLSPDFRCVFYIRQPRY